MSVVRVVAALIVRPGECLVARRSRTMSHPLAWEFPGGKVEDGEGPEAALARELREELGIEVEVGPLFAQSSAHVGSKLLELSLHRTRILAGEPRALEHAELAWLEPSALRRLTFAPLDVPIIEDVIARALDVAAP
jgi:mutator protein MutT